MRGDAARLTLLSVVLVAWAGAANAREERMLAVKPSPTPPGADEFLGCKKYPLDKKFKWTVRGEVGVAELAASLGEISCRPILVASAVASRNGKVVLEVPDLVTAADVYRLFYGALEAMGLTVDASAGAIKIIDAGRAREVASPELGSGALAMDDRFVVRLFHPEHATPAELAELLGKLKSKDGDVSVFGAASLVLIDRAVNVRRMEDVARALDVGEAGARIYTMETHGQSPTELVAALEKILSAASHHASAAPAGGDKKDARAMVTTLDGDVRALVPLDSARQIAVIGNEVGWQHVQALAARIDPPADDGAASQGHVLYLANTNAEDVAATLQSIGLGSRSGTSSSSSSRPGANGAPSSAPTSMNTANAALPLSGEVRIGADKTSNALVVYANAVDYEMVRDLVAKLDVQRRQVYVEAVILDLSLDNLRSIGVTFHQGAQTTNSSGTSTTTAAVASESTNAVTFMPTSIAAAAASGGLFAGVFGQMFSFLGTDIPSFGVVLQALETSTNSNVISRPHLLMMDNTKSSISVGQNIVYQTSSLASATTSATTALAATYTRTPVALTLELTPHLNESNSIRLEIDGNIEDVANGASTSVPGGPTTNDRKIKTAVVVRDGDCVVLGGLTKESESETVTKIPLLGDIPILGRLFQTRSKSKTKQDLLIVLTPYIIRGPEDMRRIHEQRERERQ
ncbi:MAG TPA: type II secretion system secretin GspD [Polyangia bacterium]|nr:type II secretion system secretin GspD [Polyangia bacterium]